MKDKGVWEMFTKDIEQGKDEVGGEIETEERE